jgi:hypothetical protein
MLTNQYSPTTSTSKRKRDAFDFTNNFDFARSVENDFKKPRNLCFDSKKTLTLDLNNNNNSPFNSPFNSPHSSPFKGNMPATSSPHSSPFKSNHFSSLNSPHSSPFKGNMSATSFYSFDDNKLLEWIPKSKRKQHLSGTKSDRIFTKEDLRTILENAIKETKHNHSILCDKELHIRLGEQQGTFEKIVAKENNNNNNNNNHHNNNYNNNNHNNNTINNSHNRNNSNFDYMS